MLFLERAINHLRNGKKKKNRSLKMLKICTELRERTNEVRVTFSNQSKIISKHLQESNHGIAKGRMRVLRALKTS